MKKIRVLSIIFSKQIKSKDLPYFRSAILKLLGNADPVFHNHTDDDKFVYEYPKIQYKIIGKKAAMYCVEDGVDKIYSLLNLQYKNIEIGGKNEDLQIESFNAGQSLIQAWDTYQLYNISAWLPLSEKNYPTYRNLKTDEEKKYFLENILRGNILSMGKGLDIHFER